MFDNIFVINKKEFSCAKELWKPLTKETIPEMILVSVGSEFYLQDFITDDEAKDNELFPIKGIFYIQKYNLFLSQSQFLEFVKEHLDENFLLISNHNMRAEDIQILVESKENDLKAYFFSHIYGNGQLTLIACLCNLIGEATWDVPMVLKENINLFRNDYADSDNCTLQIQETEKTTKKQITQFYIIGTGEKLTTKSVMQEYLNLPGHTRIYAVLKYSGIYYEVATGPKVKAPLNERYGIERSDSYWNNDYLHEEDIFPEAELDPVDFERIRYKIVNDLMMEKGDHKIHIGESWSGGSTARIKRVLALSSPIEGHRRPTFHFIIGFFHGGNIDVVEVARGELKIIGMEVVNCYYLSKKGGYKRISHGLFHTIKEQIQDTTTETDLPSFNIWAEEKSLQPQLIKAAIDSNNNFSLQEIKLFNTLKFGALFVEQLIKANYYKLALELAEYIQTKGDNMNFVCSSLIDIFPGSNPEGSSLLKILNTSKPCLDLILSDEDSPLTNIKHLIKRYQVVKTFAPDGIITNERLNLIKNYWKLYLIGWNTFSCQTGRTVDIINYPIEMKSVTKMLVKITKTFAGSTLYDIQRHYKEIVQAYFQFKDFGWNPEDYRIFIEFGLSGDLTDIIQMFVDREHAANEALDIYRQKINETTRKIVEQQYASRKNCLKNLESTPELQKNFYFGKYVIVMPSQIYGEYINGSIEKEGKDMGHYVYRQYANQIAKGQYTVMYLRYKDLPEKSLVTIGINSEGRINQTFTFNDNMITPEQAEAISVWAQSKKGLVTFKSENLAAARPGGWNHEVEVPVLPAPSPEFLMKLNKTL